VTTAERAETASETDGADSVAVVIPTYERPEQLRETVASVTEQTVSEYEIVVVDDGSDSEAQQSVLAEVAEHERVRVLEQANAGPAAARNRGWRATDADVICFTDDDCLVPEHWIESLLAGFEPGVGAVGGQLLPTEEAVERSPFARLHRYRNEHVYEVPSEPTRGGADLPMGGTANIAYRRSALAAVDGFDETFPTAAGEDADLQQRVADAGFDMKYVPVVVDHNDEYDWPSFRSRTIRHGSGSYYMARRHGEPRPRWRVLLGLLAAPVFFPGALRATTDPVVALLVVVERILARYGELSAY
jgi:glycosyltransferase involved in cell wall biosynthesis